MKFEELPEERQALLRRSLNDHMVVLREQTLTAGSEARRYLFFVNTGGAIALLSFMGASANVRDALAAWLALGSFFLGIVAVGVVHALNWHVIAKLLLGYDGDVRALVNSQIDLLEFDQRRAAATPRPHVALAFSYASALLFMVGADIAIFGLMPPW